MDGWPDSDGLDSGWGNLGQRDEPLGKRAAPVRRPVEQNNTNKNLLQKESNELEAVESRCEWQRNGHRLVHTEIIRHGIC